MEHIEVSSGNQAAKNATVVGFPKISENNLNELAGSVSKKSKTSLPYENHGCVVHYLAMSDFIHCPGRSYICQLSAPCQVVN